MAKGFLHAGKLPRGCVLCEKGSKMVLLVTGKCDKKCFYCPLSSAKRGKDVFFANERKVRNIEDVVDEGRLMEAVLINALHQIGREFDETLYHWQGNLPVLTPIGHDSIPGSWHIAMRRYLERCVDLYGESLATAGFHSTLSLPDPLFAWDFMHLSPTERGDIHLDDYKSRF